MTATKEFTLELQSGETVDVELPAKVPAVTGMNTRNKIKLGFEGRGSKGTLKAENAQEVVNNAQQYLVSELLSHHTGYAWKEITLETHDRIWGYYAPQIDGKKKVSTGQKSGDTSGKQHGQSQGSE